MALSRVKTWIAEVLTFADLNAEYNNILNNANSLISPFTANVAAGGFKVTGLGAATTAGDAVRFEQVTTNRNRIINGDMRIDQRNAAASQTYTAAAAVAYNVDRWYGSCTGANVTGQQVAGTTAEFAYKYTGAASVTAIIHGQRIESHNIWDLTSTNATLSCVMKNSVLTTVTWTAYYANAVDDFSAKTQISTGTFTVTSTAASYSATIAMGASAKNGVAIEFSVGAQTSGTWQIEDVQLEAGIVTPVFERKSTPQVLAECQRYYEKSFAQSVKPAQNTASYVGAFQQPQIGGAAAADYFGTYGFKVTKMGTPTITLYSPGDASAQVWNTSVGAVCSGSNAQNTGDSGFSITFTTAAGSGATNRNTVHWVAVKEL